MLLIHKGNSPGHPGYTDIPFRDRAREIDRKSSLCDSTYTTYRNSLQVRTNILELQIRLSKQTRNFPLQQLIRAKVNPPNVFFHTYTDIENRQASNDVKEASFLRFRKILLGPILQWHHYSAEDVFINTGDPLISHHLTHISEQSNTLDSRGPVTTRYNQRPFRSLVLFPWQLLSVLFIRSPTGSPLRITTHSNHQLSPCHKTKLPSSSIHSPVQGCCQTTILTPSTKAMCS